MSVTLYTKPACPQCDMTKMALTREGIAFTTVDLSKDPQAMELVMGLGHRSAPVVVTAERNWSGFQPAMIKGLVAQSQELALAA